jgi:hypothetical protein
VVTAAKMTAAVASLWTSVRSTLPHSRGDMLSAVSVAFDAVVGASFSGWLPPPLQALTVEYAYEPGTVTSTDLEMYRAERVVHTDRYLLMTGDEAGGVYVCPLARPPVAGFDVALWLPPTPVCVAAGKDLIAGGLCAVDDMVLATDYTAGAVRAFDTRSPMPEWNAQFRRKHTPIGMALDQPLSVVYAAGLLWIADESERILRFTLSITTETVTAAGAGAHGKSTADNSKPATEAKSSATAAAAAADVKQSAAAGSPSSSARTITLDVPLGTRRVDRR